MLQNITQQTDFVEVYDSKVTKEKAKITYKSLPSNAETRIFDSNLKGYVLEIQGNTTNKLIFPKEESQSLLLTQQYLLLMVKPQQNFSVELYISDVNKTKRRIIISQSHQKPQSKLFYVRVPYKEFSSNWSYICIDLWSFMAAFHGNYYRALQHIYLGGNFKLKRILTSKYCIEELSDTNLMNLPKQFQYPSQIQYSLKKITYPQFFTDIETLVSDAQTTILTKSVARPRSFRKDRFMTPTSEPNRKSQVKNRRIVNNSQSVRSKRIQLPLITKSSNKSTTTSKTANQDKMRNKNIRLPSINRSGICSQKTPSSIMCQSTLMSFQMKGSSRKPNNLDKVIVNEWRTNPSKIQPQTTYFQTNSFINKSTITTLFNKRNRHKLNIHTNSFIPQKSLYSDCEYLQMSQKFSTITDQKFFKKRSELTKVSQQDQVGKGDISIDEEIQEAIEIDVEEDNLTKQAHSKIKQQINDSVSVVKQKERDADEGLIEAYFKDFLTKAVRPYSPPLHSQENKTQEFQDSLPQFKTEIQVTYDPVLKCYYDLKTQTYYELKV